MDTLGDAKKALEIAERLKEIDPFDEEALRIQMTSLLKMGRPSSAISAYDKYHEALKRELNTLPELSLQKLYDRARAGTDQEDRNEKGVENKERASRETRRSEAHHFSLPPSNLVSPLTSFIGRESEIQSLTDLILNSRLVTLTGPGGIGKTRLSLEAASRLKERFQNRVWFVVLAESYTLVQMRQSIFESLNLVSSQESEKSETSIIEALTGKRVLLVLDNLEQLLIDPEEAEKVCFTLKRLLSALPELTCLVTSRQILSLEGEKEFALLPLQSPVGEEGIERLSQLSSVQLLIERASQIRPDFKLTPENFDTVRRISSLLEGYPLAIELAVGWIRALDLEGVESRLIDRFELLVSRRRDIPERHRTLYTAIERSYQYLPEGLQKFFRTMAVFRGGCDYRACERVCAVERPENFLIELQERSLVVAESSGLSTRFRFLETIREFALMQCDAGERQRFRDAHARYFQTFLSDIRTRAWNSASPKVASEAINLAVVEMDNLRSAIQWLLESDQPELACKLAIDLDWLWMVRGYFKERREMALLIHDRFYDPIQSSNDQKSIFHNASSYFSDELRLQLARENLANRRSSDDMLELGEALVTLAGLSTDHTEIENMFTEAVETLKKQTDSYRTHLAQANFAGYYTSQQKYEKSLPILNECLEYVRQTKDFWGEAKILLAIGHNLRNSGHSERAYEILSDSRKIYLQLEDPWHLQDVECNLMETCLQMGKREEAMQLVVSVKARGANLNVPYFIDIANRIENELNN